MNALYIFLSVVFLIYMALLVMVSGFYIRARMVHHTINSQFDALAWYEYLFLSHQILWGTVKLLYWRLLKNKASGSSINQPKNNTLHIVCIHGFQMDGSCFNGFRAFLNEQHFASSAIELGKPYIPIEQYVSNYYEQLTSVINQLNNKKLVLIAHSMGGLITRMLLKEHPELQKSIVGVITLGTPHRGTAILTNNRDDWICKLFHPQNSLLATLPDFSELIPESTCYSIASAHDLIVYPSEYAHLPGMKQKTVRLLSHIGFLTSPPVYQKIWQLITNLQQK